MNCGESIDESGDFCLMKLTGDNFEQWAVYL